MSIQIRWLAHAAFQIKFDKKTMYIDPRYMKSLESKIGSFFEDPDKADVILITHHHADHCYPSSFKKMLSPDTKIIAPELCAKKLGNDFKRIKPGEKIRIDDIQVRAVDAYNIKRHRTSGRLWHIKGEGVGYLVTIDGNTIYHAGDTEFIPEMKYLENVDVALLPIDGKFTMNISEAIDAVMAIKPKIVIPMHTMEADPQELKKKVEAESNVKVVPLQIGEVYHLK